MIQTIRLSVTAESYMVVDGREEGGGGVEGDVGVDDRVEGCRGGSREEAECVQTCPMLWLGR